MFTGISDITIVQVDTEDLSLTELECIPVPFKTEEQSWLPGFTFTLSGEPEETPVIYVNWQLKNQDNDILIPYLPGNGVIAGYPTEPPFIVLDPSVFDDVNQSFTLCLKVKELLEVTESREPVEENELEELCVTFNACEIVSPELEPPYGIEIENIEETKTCPDKSVTVEFTGFVNEGQSIYDFIDKFIIKVYNINGDVIFSEEYENVNSNINIQLDNVPDGIITVKHVVILSDTEEYNYSVGDIIIRDGKYYVYSAVGEGYDFVETENIYSEYKFLTLCNLQKCYEDKVKKSVCEKCNCENGICSDQNYFDTVRLNVLALDVYIDYNLYSEATLQKVKENLLLAEKLCCKC